MELRWIVVVFLSCMAFAGTQRTFKRSCDCEYMVDGKCAYTLLLPAKYTCSGDKEGGGGGGGSNAMLNMELLEHIEQLKVNMTDLRINSGDQAQMLSRLQSLLMTQQTSLTELRRDLANAIAAAGRTQCQLCPELGATLSAQLADLRDTQAELERVWKFVNMTGGFGMAGKDSEMLMEEVMKLAEMMNKTTAMQMMKMGNSTKRMNSGIDMMMKLMNASTSDMMGGNMDMVKMMMMNASMSGMMDIMESIHMMNRSMRMEMREMFEMMNKSMMMTLKEMGDKMMNKSDGEKKMSRCDCKTKMFACDKRGLLVSGPHANISDDMITASSMYNDLHAGTRGRIFSKLDKGFPGAWCAREVNRTTGEEEPNDPEEWLQFDLGKTKPLLGVVTRGRSDYDQWVTSYRVNYTDADPSLDTTTWMAYNGVLGDPEDFQGNMDRNTAKVNMFWQPIRARYVRIIPTASSDANKCMRADVIGCLDDQ